MKSIKRVNLVKIKQLRQMNKLSQSNMAEILGLSTLYKYHRKESGSQPFEAEELYAIANYFKKPVEYFFDDEVAKNAI